MKLNKRIAIFALTLCSFSWSLMCSANPMPRIAIVIDDLGYQLESSQWLAELPYPITMAIIPHSPHAKEAVQNAQKHQQELILHVPMEIVGPAKWEDGLTTAMNRATFQSTFTRMLDEYPSILGINNHGGSLLTTDFKRMQWLMDTLSKRELFFLDSRTTSQSQAILAAKDLGVDHASRDVFLDNDRSKDALAKQFQRLRQIAKEHGQAIAIGHPHPETLTALSKQLPALIEEGFELLFCSQLLTQTKVSEEAI